TKAAAASFVAETGGLATPVEGRNPDPTHEWGCHRHGVIVRIGAARHNPAGDVCRACPFADSCNYLRRKRAGEGAQVVAAPVASFFWDGSDLGGFDVVVVDEALVPALTETLTLDQGRIDGWRARMRRLNAEDTDTGRPKRYGPDDPFVRLCGVLEAA